MAEATEFASMTTREQWSLSLLSFGDWLVSQEKVIGIVSWQVAENSEAIWNPLDTTEPAPGATDYNSAGVKNYPTEQIGIEAVYATLHNGRYQPILACLSDPSGSSALALASAVGQTPWGTGNFSTTVERVKANPALYFDQPVHGSGSVPPDPPGPGTPTRGLLAMLGLNDAQVFVRFCYLTLLIREPDQAGYDKWVGDLTSGTLTEDEVMAGIQDSPEGVQVLADKRRVLGLPA